VKSICASILGRWIVTPQWILDSSEAGYFVEEQRYGTQCLSSPIFQKKIFISSEYKKENEYQKGFESNIYPLFIEKLAKGSIVNDPKEAEFCLVSTKQQKFNGKKNLTFTQFIDCLQRH